MPSDQPEQPEPPLQAEQTPLVEQSLQVDQYLGPEQPVHEDPPPERIGVVVVHGIGEQKRFEHLDAQVREIVRGLVARTHGGEPSKFTVEIFGGGFASFGAEQDTWASGDQATARVVFRDAGAEKILHIYFHEVWWADVNEPFSLAKQVRFWMWGLVIAFIPRKRHSKLAGASSSRDPIAPGGVGWLSTLWVRARLFGVSFVAVLGAMSIGLLTFLAKRLLNLEPPDFIKVFVNYVAGVKLYNQRKRYGAGFPGKQMDFLNSISEPPRVSVRRRMIRVIAQAARADYQRWYIIAHSLGTVVAYNGLMESAYAWPGYFDEATWNELVKARMAGPARAGWRLPEGQTLPARPVWCAENAIAYRSRIFEKLHGVLMMGTPLEKFATLWPGRVPISAEPAFRDGTRWLSIYDPIDPVSGILRAFTEDKPGCLPSPETIGYAANPVLLISHIRYLTWLPGGSTLADGVAHWLVTGERTRITAEMGPRWFAPYAGADQTARSRRHRTRSCWAWRWWMLAVFVLTIAGALSLPVLWGASVSAITAAWKFIGGAALWNAIEQAMSSAPPVATNAQSKIGASGGQLAGGTTLASIPTLLDSFLTFLKDAVILWVIAIVLPLVAGTIASLRALRPDEDDSGQLRKEADRSGLEASPEPTLLVPAKGAWEHKNGAWQ